MTNKQRAKFYDTLTKKQAKISEAAVIERTDAYNNKMYSEYAKLRSYRSYMENLKKLRELELKAMPPTRILFGKEKRVRRIAMQCERYGCKPPPNLVHFKAASQKAEHRNSWMQRLEDPEDLEAAFCAFE